MEETFGQVPPQSLRKFEGIPGPGHHAARKYLFASREGPSNRLAYRETFRRRKALAMTETELKLIAALASMGLSSQPKIG